MQGKNTSHIVFYCAKDKPPKTLDILLQIVPEGQEVKIPADYSWGSGRRLDDVPMRYWEPLQVADLLENIVIMCLIRPECRNLKTGDPPLSKREEDECGRVNLWFCSDYFPYGFSYFQKRMQDLIHYFNQLPYG
jgi:hypothetical protein